MNKEIRCYIEQHYKIDHSKESKAVRDKFVTLGNLFDGKPICIWCLTRLAVVADAYGHSQKGSIRGNVVNVDVKVPLHEMINRSPLKAVFDDYDLAEIKHNIDHNLFELKPQTPIQPYIESEIERISGFRTVR